jgi:hypothetical protein
LGKIKNSNQIKYIFGFILVVGSLYSITATASNCDHRQIQSRNTSLLQTGEVKSPQTYYLGAHNNRILMNLLDVDVDDPETVEEVLGDPKMLMGYIKGAKEMSSTMILSMKNDLPGILSLLRENRHTLKWIGVETSPKNFPIILRSIEKGRKIKTIMEEKIPDDAYPDKDREIKHFIMAAYGLDVYLAIYHQDLVGHLEYRPLESDAVIESVDNRADPLMKEMRDIRTKDCRKQDADPVCEPYNRTLSDIIGKLEPLTIGDIDQRLSGYPDSAFKQRARQALIGSLEWVKIQHERDVAVAENISSMRDPGFVIFGKNHTKIIPNMERICREGPGTRSITPNGSTGGATGGGRR